MTSNTPTEVPNANSFETHLAFWDSRWVPRDSIVLSIDDIGFRQGVTAVERLRTYDGNLFALDEHLRRWSETTRLLRIEGLPSAEKTESVLQELLSKNEALIRQSIDVGVTMFATPGTMAGMTGENAPTFVAHLNPLNHSVNQSRRVNGQVIVTSPFQSPPEASWSRSAKVRSRIHYYLADRQARDQSPGAVGLLCDQDGSVTETSIANLAIVNAGRITSPQTEQVLGGVTQLVCEQLASSLEIPWNHERISRDQLVDADEVLLMGTDSGIWFARQVDDSAINDGRIGPVCRELQKAFGSRTGEDGI